MILCTVGHSFRYELEKLCRLFLPFEKIEFADEAKSGDAVALTVFEKGGQQASLFVSLDLNSKHEQRQTNLEISDDIEERSELQLAVMLWDCFNKITGIRPEWGVLTGVRPAKLFRRLEQQDSKSEAERYFIDQLLVTQEKTKLCSETSSSEDRIISFSKPDSFSLYASIPFCPSRCSYCSFVSHSVDKSGRFVPKYLDLLCSEMEQTGKISAELGLKMETAYIGGGTPTTLNADQLKRLIETMRGCFSFQNCREFTVEAGRPDTITEDKLKVLYDGGVGRISINPQTMNDVVLEGIGRKHTAKQTTEAFQLAREIGFNNINMDLIAGLPGDTFESFCNTLETIISMDPDSITVHSLSLKRASTLNTSKQLPSSASGDITAAMVEYARKRLTEVGILPYYMYRQSKTVGNLENVGYAKPGFEGLYNVYIMDETHSILACGASAVTKLRQPGENRIERIYNFKYPYEYIDRFEEIMQRKKGISEFYDKYCRRD